MSHFKDLPGLLRRFRPFVHGVPCHDRLGVILATLDAVAFQHCFVAWVVAVAGLAPDAIAGDRGRIETRTTTVFHDVSWLEKDHGWPGLKSLDMTFHEDECRVRTDRASADFITIRHMACNLLRNAPGKDSMRMRRKTAGWDDDFLARLIG